MTQLAVATDENLDPPAEDGHEWAPAAGTVVRGSVVLLPGRGEHAGVYERFGRRIAADGYHVHALDRAHPDPVERAIARAQTVGGPVVLAGSDTGALHALIVAAGGGNAVAGLLLAGAPPLDAVAAQVALAGWTDELAARTACPTHQARLNGDPGIARGRLGTAVPAALAHTVRGLALANVTIPALVVHGSADVIAPIAGARALASRLPNVELSIVDGGRHDILNDAHHRSVAAHITLWLERLRTNPDAAPIVTVEPAIPRGGTR